MLSLILAASLSQPDYSKDFDELWGTVKQYSAYLSEDRIDWDSVRSYYSPKFKQAASQHEFMDLLEKVMGEMRDFHASLGANNDRSPRLVPSGTDLYATWKDGKAVLEQVRQYSGAQKAGLLPGDIIVNINNLKVRDASFQWLGNAQKTHSARAWEWALNSALAGRWNTKRELVIIRQGHSRHFTLETYKSEQRDTPLTVQKLSGNIVYLRPEDSLGQNQLITEFDRLLPDLRKAKAVILDLRNTPSGGTSAVARGIMGLFISQRMPYQRHIVDEAETKTRRDWVEFATPRTSKPCKAQMVVLVNRWTGSMGEGIAIGFDGLRRAKVVGTKMARLRGAIESFELPESHIRFFFPTEKLFHVNGIPRHEWEPKFKVAPGPGDPWMTEAMRVLK